MLATRSGKKSRSFTEKGSASGALQPCNAAAVSFSCSAGQVGLIPLSLAFVAVLAVPPVRLSLILSGRDLRTSVAPYCCFRGARIPSAQRCGKATARQATQTASEDATSADGDVCTSIAFQASC